MKMKHIEILTENSLKEQKKSNETKQSSIWNSGQSSQVSVVDKKWLKRKVGLHSLANRKQHSDIFKAVNKETDKLLLRDRC